jgi:hypothetical protein
VQNLVKMIFLLKLDLKKKQKIGLLLTGFVGEQCPFSAFHG